MSLPIYALAGFDRSKLRSNESALKYFLMGSFTSAILLYGMALLYGATGHTDFVGVSLGFSQGGPLAVTGLALVIVGLAFKVAAVPFHQWAPDVYEGAPTSVTAFMAVTVKTAAFVALLRFLALALPEMGGRIALLMQVFAALTMVVGNVMAIIQTNVKRMLAYSSISHAGYLLVGLRGGHPRGLDGAPLLPARVRLHDPRRLLRGDGIGPGRPRVGDLRRLLGAGFERDPRCRPR